MSVEAIKLSAGFTERHQLALLNSIVSPISTSPRERQDLLDAIDLLRSSRVQVDGESFSFARFFDQFIDKIYTDKFILKMLPVKRISSYGQKLKKNIITEIRSQFIREQWLRHDLAETRFLIAFCLYWWNSFATGYLFEMEVFRDLEDSGVVFNAHDLRKRAERYSFADLTIAGKIGDVKSSTYFFSVARTSALLHDFYISRYYDKNKRRYHWFVILRLEYWKEINGDTEPMRFPNWPANFARPVAFDFRGTDWAAVSYQVWKVKILTLQR